MTYGLLDYSTSFVEPCSGLSCRYCNVPDPPRCDGCGGEDGAWYDALQARLCEWCYDGQPARPAVDGPLDDIPF